MNFCKHPGCPNYGVPALAGVSRTRITADSVHDHSELDRGTHPPVPLLHCQLCKEEPPIKRNRAIAEERARLLRELQPRPDSTCPNPVCGNHSIPIPSRTDPYQSFGKSQSGSQRYRCKACTKTFSVGGATVRQKAPLSTGRSLPSW